MQREKRQRWQLMALLYLGMFYLGILMGVRTLTLPLIKDSFGADYGAQSLLMFLTTAMGTVATFTAGVLYRRMGEKGCFLMSLATGLWVAVITGLAPSYSVVTLGLLVVSFTTSFYEISKNAIAQRVFGLRVAANLTVVHGMYGIGNILGPKWGEGLILSGLSWRGVYLALLAPVLVLGILCLVTPFGPRVQPAAAQPAVKQGFTLKQAFRLPVVWAFGLAIAMSSVVEGSFGNWALLYFQDVFALDPVTFGATFMAVFFGFFTGSRLLLGSVVERMGYLRTLRLCTLGVIVLFALSFALGRQGVWLLAPAGMCIGLYVPTQLAFFMRRYGADATLMISAAMVIAGLVSAVGQYLIGQFSNWFGPAWGFRSLLIYAALYLIFLGLSARLSRMQAGSSS